MTRLVEVARWRMDSRWEYCRGVCVCQQGLAVCVYRGLVDTAILLLDKETGETRREIGLEGDSGKLCAVDGGSTIAVAAGWSVLFVNVNTGKSTGVECGGLGLYGITAGPRGDSAIVAGDSSGLLVVSARGAHVIKEGEEDRVAGRGVCYLPQTHRLVSQTYIWTDRVEIYQLLPEPDDKSNIVFEKLAKVLERPNTDERETSPTVSGASPGKSEDNVRSTQHETPAHRSSANRESGGQVPSSPKPGPSKSTIESDTDLYFDQPREIGATPAKLMSMTRPVEGEEKGRLLSELKEVISASKSKTDKETALVSVWDFAGQSAFYTTHQVYLSQRAVYILVIDISRNVDDMVEDDQFCFDSFGSKSCQVAEFVEFWLNSIHCYCGDSDPTVPPVILVATHTDLLDKDRKDDQVKSYFQRLKGIVVDKESRANHVVPEYFSVDNTTPDDPQFDRLKQVVLEVAKQQPYWGRAVPATWISMEMTFERLRQNKKVLSRPEISQVNQTLPVPLSSDEEIDLFLKYQHDLGTLLYFSDPHLRDQILLQPQWVIDAIKCIITEESFIKLKPAVAVLWKSFKSHGLLKQELIEAMWQTTQFWEFHKYLVSLMERLDLIAHMKLDQSTEKNTYLVPCVLKEGPPEELLQPPNYTPTSKLCYTTKARFVPMAVFNRLLAACLSKWPVFMQNRRPCIFCGCGMLEVAANHCLTLYFRGDFIQTWVGKFGKAQTKPESGVCSTVRVYIEDTLKRVLADAGSSSEIEQFIKCPEADLNSLHEMIPLNLFHDNVEVTCTFHDEAEILTSEDLLQGWFSAGQKDLTRRDESEVLSTRQSVVWKDCLLVNKDQVDTVLRASHVDLVVKFQGYDIVKDIYDRLLTKKLILRVDYNDNLEKLKTQSLSDGARELLEIVRKFELERYSVFREILRDLGLTSALYVLFEQEGKIISDRRPSQDHRHQ